MKGILVACLYLPNGNPQPGPKFDYKLAWFDRLIAHAAEPLALDAPVVLAGDFNVVPDRRGHLSDALLDEERAAAAGKPGALPPPARPGLDRRCARPPPGRDRCITFWDYMRRSLAARRRPRIDLLLLSRKPPPPHRRRRRPFVARPRTAPATTRRSG